MGEPLFKLDSNYDAVLHPEAVGLAPKLRVLSKVEFKYIVLAHDYQYSKFHKFPKEEMIMLAKKECFKNDPSYEPEDDDKMIEAIQEYKELNYDELREEKKAYQSKLIRLRKKLLTEDEMASSAMRNLRENMSFMKHEIDELDRKIDISDEHVQLKGKNRTLSMIEIWQRKQKRHNKMNINA